MIIVGDSHADAITTAATSSLNLKNEGAIALVKSGGVYKFVNRYNTADCNIINQKRTAYLQQHIGVPIIVSNRYTTKFLGENDPERNKFHINELNISTTNNDYLLFKKEEDKFL